VLEEMKMFLLNKEKLSPSEYLRLTEKDRSAIKSSRIIPPKLGSDSFGEIEVTYRHPKYVHNFFN